MSAKRQSSQSGRSPSSSNSRREVHPKIKCSCGNDAVIRTVKNCPNMGMRFYGCPLWPINTQCEMFKRLNTSNCMEDMQMQIFEKDIIICEMEKEQKMRDEKIKKL
uniref:GRF-type domain-containing protein n=1 Tax=Chenopodium quinoa TaxID=63459 RepID=A0A803MD62_CHEQI